MTTNDLKQPGLGQLKEEEAVMIAGRRAQAGVPLDRPPVGIAFSGGGIRSATFCLGICQGLARHGLLRYCDYLSTVSGGGYLGGFLGRMFTRPWANDPNHQLPPSDTRSVTGPANLRGPQGIAWFDALKAHCHTAVERVEETLRNNDSPPLRWLRESGTYLAPHGSGDTVLAVAALLRNWVTVLLVILTPVLTFFIGHNLLRALLGRSCAPYQDLEGFLAEAAQTHLWWTPAVIWPAMVMLFFVLPLGWAYWLTQKDDEVADGPPNDGAAGQRPRYWRVKRWPFWKLPVLNKARFIALVMQGKHWLFQKLPVLVPVVICVASALHARSAWVKGELGYAALMAVIATLAVLTWVYWQVAMRCHNSGKTPQCRRRIARNQLTYGLKCAAVVFVAALVFAVLDGWGQSIYALLAYAGDSSRAVPGILTLTGLASLAPLARVMLARIQDGKPGASGPVKLSLRALLTIGAVALSLLLVLGVSTVAHGVAWNWRCPAPSQQVLSVGDDLVPVPANSPAALLFQRGNRREGVDLTQENLVRVKRVSSPETAQCGQARLSVWVLAGGTLVGLILTWIFGNVIGFLNLSSFHAFYTARLIRAYPGASNERRWLRPDTKISEVDPDDDVSWRDYQPHRHGGPLHLVNSNLNTTMGLETRMELKTTKGLNLCVGPGGLSIGLRHALWGKPVAAPEASADEVRLAEPASEAKGREPFMPRQAEPLSLGSWVGISGAAFTTGLGNVGGGGGSSLGTSLICGLFNVRLGYWWRNTFSPSNAGSLNSGDAWFPVYTYLLDEFLGTFRLEHRDRWYLSDGGHFENTAAYELIRRRVPFIVIVDAGADPDGNLEDLSNLTRRVRIDFGAEIAFLNRRELIAQALHPALLVPNEAQHESPGKPGLIGDLADLRPQGSPEAGDLRQVRANAALARVTYADSNEISWLLVIKPGLTQATPVDLQQYQKENPTFPQQTTLDQFFDEAQWESYRKLGELVASNLFQSASELDQEWRQQHPSAPASLVEPWLPRHGVVAGEGPL